MESDETAAANNNLTSTPSIVVKGPKGQAQAIQGVPTWPQLQQTINSVS